MYAHPTRFAFYKVWVGLGLLCWVINYYGRLLLVLCRLLNGGISLIKSNLFYMVLACL